MLLFEKLIRIFSLVLPFLDFRVVNVKHVGSFFKVSVLLCCFYI